MIVVADRLDAMPACAADYPLEGIIGVLKVKRYYYTPLYLP